LPNASTGFAIKWMDQDVMKTKIDITGFAIPSIEHLEYST